MKHFSDTTWIESWKSKGMSEESIENLIKSEIIFAPIFVDQLLLPNKNFNGHCLIKNNNSVPKKTINLYISYTLCIQLKNLNTDFTLGNLVISLFGSIRPTRNADLGKYKYTGYSKRFGSRSEFLFTDRIYEKMSLFLVLV